MTVWPGLGVSTTNSGFRLSTKTVTVLSACRPASSTAETRSSWEPSGTLTKVENKPSETPAGWPLMVRVTVDSSFAVPLTSTTLCVSRSLVLGDEIVTVGGSRSRTNSKSRTAEA